MLSDFMSAMMQSLLQFAAQETSYAIISGLLSFIPGVGAFTSIAGKLGSKLFGGGNSNIKGKVSAGDGIGGIISTPTSSSQGVGHLQQLVTETRALRMDLRSSKPTVYVGGVISPDAIVSENLRKSERRRARRLK